jgi:signal transduction histidine kinase
MTNSRCEIEQENAHRLAQLATIQRLLADQREANEHLVLAMIQAQERSDSAAAAQIQAELLLQELRETAHELHAKVRFGEQLLGVVGHDLRNPLGAVSVCIQFLMLQANLGEEGKRLLLLSQRTLERMSRLIQQLFEFTRARVGCGVELRPRATDMQVLCRSAVEELSLSSSVPIQEEFRGDTTGTWDAERLEEVLSNLIGNALDHATKGTAVEVKGYGAGEDVILDVVNRGEPIPPALLPVLFVAFHQGASEYKIRPGHLGLGLFIAHEIVRSHGGVLTASSAAGKTTFTMRLPRCQRAA